MTNQIAVWWLAHPVGWALGAFVLLQLLLGWSRGRAHRFVLLLANMGSSPLRALSRRLTLAAAQMARRNQTVLFAQARAETGVFLEQEFRSVDRTLEHDLAAFPALQQRLLRQIEGMEVDYQQALHPPEPPLLPGLGGRGAGDPGLRRTVNRLERAVVAEYRRSWAARQRVLEQTGPALERMRSTLARVDGTLAALRARALHMDAYMSRYDAFRNEDTQVERSLRLSSVAQLLAAVLLLALGAAGEWVHLRLLSHSLVVWVGPSAQMFAAGILVIEAMAGLALCEGLGLTALLGGMLRARGGVSWAATGLLVLPILMEAAIAGLAHAPVPLAGMAETAGIRGATLVLLGLGLAWLPIPLETLTHSLRTVSGATLVALLGLVARVPAASARLLRQLALAVLLLYDATILPMLLLAVAQSAWRARRLKRVPASVDAMQ